jgi:hypothetical protein
MPSLGFAKMRASLGKATIAARGLVRSLFQLSHHLSYFLSPPPSRFSKYRDKRGIPALAW